MSWIHTHGKLLFQQPASAEDGQEVDDPFNFLMNRYLHHYQGDTTALIISGTQRFPLVATSALQRILQEVIEAYRYAAARQYDARDGLLTPLQVEQQVRSQFPQLKEATLQSLLTQTLIGASR